MVNKKKLLISFSGGETSAFMAYWLWTNKRDKYDMVFVFANTGEENEATLLFLKQCSEYFGWPVVWVEAVTSTKYRKGVTAKVVDFNTASRNGEPFAAMIAKHGIPNKATPHCSRELKLRAIQAYMKSIGWKHYYTAIGIRADEPERVNKRYKELRLIYPLIADVPMTKPDINRFWAKMPFRLRLRGYQGNCKVCWKKSIRKLLTIAMENPEAFDFFREMEQKFENYTPKSRQHNEKIKPPHRFFRDNLSVQDIMDKSKLYFEPSEDDAVAVHEVLQLAMFDDMAIKDGGGNCVESCEMY